MFFLKLPKFGNFKRKFEFISDSIFIEMLKQVQQIQVQHDKNIRFFLSLLKQ